MSLDTDVAEIKRDVKNLCHKQDEQIEIQKAFCKLRHDPIEQHMKDGEGFRDKVNKHSAVIPVISTIVILMVSGVITALIFVLRAKLSGL